MIDSSIKEIAEFLKKQNTIAVCAHVNPDGDALGSLLALGLSLEMLDKKVHFLIDDSVPKQFAFLPHIEKVRKPKQLEVDTLIVLDASDYERIGAVKDLVKAKHTLNIDHHISNKGFTDIRYLDVKAAATCEIIFTLIQELGITINDDIAINTYTGIATDCGFFRYANTTAKTLRIAAELVDIGVQPNIISDYMEVQPVESLYILPKILETLDFYLDKKIASISIVPAIYREDIEGDSFIRYPRYIDGVEVAVLFKGISEQVTRISMRSKNLDVSKVALSFGGGGHIRAAGCTIEVDITKAKQLIFNALAKSFGENN